MLGADRCSPIITGSIDQARAEFRRYVCVSGHLFFHPGADISDLRSATILRDPIERILSHLAYSRNDVTPSGDAFSQRARALTLEAYLESDDPEIVRTISNTMAAHFAPLAWDGIEELSPERMLALAKTALEAFDVVGLTERMNETADIVCRLLELPPPREVPRLNAGSRSISARDLPTSLRDRLSRLNELDVALYAHARRLHDHCRRRAIFGPEYSGHASVPHGGQGHAAVTKPAPAGSGQPKADFGSREAELIRVDAYGQTGLGATLLAGEVATIRIVFRAHAVLDDLTVGFNIVDEGGRLVFGTNTRCHGYALEAEPGTDASVAFTFRVDLGPGQYRVGASLHPSASHLPKCYHWVDDLGAFAVVGNMGWHFEGLVKLHPEIAFSAVRTRPDSSRDDTQQLARLSPVVTDFRARLTAPHELDTLLTSQIVAVQLDVVNLGSQTWPSTGERPVRVSYHWAARGGEIVVFDGDRTPLDRDLAPNATARLWASVRAPEAPGDYILQLSMLQEAVGWLEGQDGATLDMHVSVVASR